MLLPLRAVAYALAVFCVFELFQLPGSAYTGHPTNLLAVLGLSFSHLLAFVAPQLTAAIAWNQWLHHPAWSTPQKRRLVGIALAAAAILPAYAILTDEPPIARHAPVVAVYVSTFLAMVIGLWLLDEPVARRLPLPEAARGLLRKGVVGAGISGGIGLYLANLYIEPGQHDTFHLSVAQLSFAALALGFSGLHRPRESPARGQKLAAALAFVTMLPPIVLLTSAGEAARPRFIHDTILGQSRRIFGLDQEDAELTTGRHVVRLGRTRARRTFREHSGLPELPSEFNLMNHNLLLITIECARRDQTSLHDPSLDTTPNLLAWRDAGGVLDFRRAYSPSAGTLHSMGAIFAMAPPSAVPMATWQLNWRGELFPEATTLPEQLYAVGFETIWLGHNHNEGFDRYILGFGQGFESRELIPASDSERFLDADAKIADALSAKLRELAEKRSHFFIWSAFDSPHAAYLPHYDDRPQSSDLERYRQELHYADEQLGRVLQTLDETGLADNTVVVITADHGEEFEEHGGRFHKSTLYSEVTHVPLLIHVPGMQGTAFEAPTSLSYVFPWLLLRGPEPLERFAETAIRDYFGPLMVATDGGVLLELIGNGRMQASLVYPRYKINYDFQSELYELYDVQRDPLEQEDLFVTDPQTAQQHVEHVSAYRKWRRRHRRFEILGDKREPTPIELGVNSRF